MTSCALARCRFSKQFNKFKAQVKRSQGRKVDIIVNLQENNLSCEDEIGKSLWQKIQKFYTFPQSFECKEYLCKKLREDLDGKFPKNVVEQKLKDLLKSIECYQSDKDYLHYLSIKSEYLVVDGVTKIMKGRPGLFLRGEHLKKKDFEALKSVLGDFNEKVDDMEVDGVLMYPGKDKLEIRLFEVKRAHDGSLKHEHIEKASQQLQIDVMLIDWILKDIPADKINVKAFISLDISKRKKLDNFCDVCSENVLFQEDFSHPSSQNLAEKLSMEEIEEKEEDQQIKDYFRKACFRFINLLPGLHRSKVLEEIKEKIIVHENDLENQLKVFNDETKKYHSAQMLQKLNEARDWIEKYPKDLERQLTVFDEPKYWMMKYQDGIEKELVIFNFDQRKTVKRLTEDNEIKNFSFSGGPGTGKTLMAIECCKRLLERYERFGVKKVVVYVTTMWAGVKDAAPLMEFYRNQIENCSNIHFKSLDRLSQDLGVKNKIENPYSRFGREQYMKGMIKVINEVSRKLKKCHIDDPVIFICDEILYKNDESYDEFLIPPGYQTNIKKPSSIVNLILAYNPASKHTMKILPDASSSVLEKQFLLRYRSTEKIQKLTQFVSKRGNKSFVDEELVPCVPGDFPEWINIQWDNEKWNHDVEYSTLKLREIKGAIQYMVNLTGDRHNKVFLYDKIFSRTMAT